MFSFARHYYKYHQNSMTSWKFDGCSYHVYPSEFFYCDNMNGIIPVGASRYFIVNKYKQPKDNFGVPIKNKQDPYISRSAQCCDSENRGSGRGYFADRCNSLENPKLKSYNLARKIDCFSSKAINLICQEYINSHRSLLGGGFVISSKFCTKLKNCYLALMYQQDFSQILYNGILIVHKIDLNLKLKSTRCFYFNQFSLPHRYIWGVAPIRCAFIDDHILVQLSVYYGKLGDNNEYDNFESEPEDKQYFEYKFPIFLATLETIFSYAPPSFVDLIFTCTKK